MFYFSQQNDPNKWGRTSHRIWVGHPAIARAIVRFLGWLVRRKRS